MCGKAAVSGLTSGHFRRQSHTGLHILVVVKRNRKDIPWRSVFVRGLYSVRRALTRTNVGGSK